MVTLLIIVMTNGGPLTWKQALHQESVCRLFCSWFSQQAPGLKEEDRQICIREPTLSPAWLRMPVIQYWGGGRQWQERLSKSEPSLYYRESSRLARDPHWDLCLNIPLLKREPRFMSSESRAQCSSCTLARLRYSFAGKIPKPRIILIKQALSITNPLTI